MITPYASTQSKNPVYFVIQNTLEVINEVFQTAGVPLPEKQFITVGTPVADCEQLVVAWRTLQRGIPGSAGAGPDGAIVEGKHCTYPRTVTLAVSLIRCWPTGVGARGPDDADVNNAARLSAMDAWLMYDALLMSDSWGLGSIVSIDAGEPQGGFLTLTGNAILAVP